LNIVIAAIAIWGLLLVACVSVNRTLYAPPQVPGANFVGSQECAMCHEDITRHFDSATHARMTAAGPNAQNVGCESCHGPGSLHVSSGGAANTIVNPSQSPEACFQCHIDKRGEFALPHTHPMLPGRVTCTSCHNPHRGDAIMAGGVALPSMNDTCTSCHAAQRGPFVFEHEAAREGCVTCHNPHGSVNDKLLRARNASLCLQCHFQQQTATGQLLIGGRDHSAFLSRGACWSAGCHEAVHGSHVNSSLRF
jgi:predicted CXXCH cytochrome family protein